MIRLRPNPAAIAQIKARPAYQRGLAKVARDVAEKVRAAAPTETGHFARSVKSDGTTVTTNDIAAHLIEWGSVKNPPYAPFRRGVKAAGLRLEEHNQE